MKAIAIPALNLWQIALHAYDVSEFITLMHGEAGNGQRQCDRGTSTDQSLQQGKEGRNNISFRLKLLAT